LKKIRQSLRLKDIPVIAVTAYAMMGDAERILAFGFDGYLPKPVNAMKLAAQVRDIVEAKQG